MKKYITAPLFIALFCLYSLYSFAIQHSRALLNLSASYTLFSADTARFITENYIWFQLSLTAVLAIFLIFLFFICKKSDDISAVYRSIFVAMAVCAIISLIMGFYVGDTITPYIVPLITMSAYTLAVPLLAKAAPMLFGFPLLCGIKLILASSISALIETPQKEQTDI